MFAEDRLERLRLICIPMMIVLLGCGASMVRPHVLLEVLDVLTAWTCASVPLAVLFGHCALNDE
jgi:hypothetical protein